MLLFAVLRPFDLSLLPSSAVLRIALRCGLPNSCLCAFSMPSSAEQGLRQLNLQASRSQGRSDDAGDSSDSSDSEDSSTPTPHVHTEPTVEAPAESDGSDDSDDSGSDADADDGNPTMVASTRNTARRGQRVSRGRSSRTQSAAGPSSAAAESPIVRSQSGLLYTMSGLSVQAANWARRGLQNSEVTLVSCVEDSENSNFLFRVRDSEVLHVRLGDPQGRNYNVPTCDCGARTNLFACKVCASHAYARFYACETLYFFTYFQTVRLSLT